VRHPSHLSRPLLLGMATLFAAATILYASLWMYAVRHQVAPVELGFNSEYSEAGHCLLIQSVTKGSPAEQAGLRAGDCILAVDGRSLVTARPVQEIWFHSRPGDSVELTAERPGQPGTMILHGTFRAAKPNRSEGGFARASALEVTGSYPVLFLVVGLTVLFLRLDDANAWLLALLFAGFIAVAPAQGFLPFSPAFAAFVRAFRATFQGMFAALFYFFFAVFPARSPLERRVPWLKWAAFALGACVTLPGLRAGEVQAPAILVRAAGEHVASLAVLFYIYLFLALGFVSLAGNARRASSPETCRKSRVILWGTLVGVLPIAAERAAMDFAGYRPSFWLDTILIIVLSLFPLSFAYAVVKHRVLEIPLLLRRSARYVLVQRGFLVLLVVVAAGAIVFFARTFSGWFGAEPKIAMAASAVFGIALVWASAPLVKRGTERIDRAFFRSAYDARLILEDLAEKARIVNDRRDLAALIEQQIGDALHPQSLVVYLEAENADLIAERGAVPRGLATLSPALPVLADLARRGKSWDGPWPEEAAGGERSPLAPLEPECLIPMLGRDSRLVGLLVLGPRLSEEPYSREDKRLLDSVASQAGIALESIRLAEGMAERMQVERLAAQEMEIAREVQAGLFPQTMPPLRTLEYAGGCIQARTVGGDYYDFLDLGSGRLGIVLADIAGKGISGALLMANLQANLRSQYAIALEDLPRLLESANRLFYENTPRDRYATLFFGDYDDATRCLRYANCGHNAPLLLRAAGTLERLPATTTVLGLFREWECPTDSVTLYPGDTLVIYTDGITEAPDSRGKEFGEARLVELARSLRDLPAAEMVTRIHAAVEEHSGSVRADDLTLVIGRAR
jgi:phosphoserine phosphatase RsbU/P